MATTSQLNPFFKPYYKMNKIFLNAIIENSQEELTEEELEIAQEFANDFINCVVSLVNDNVSIAAKNVMYILRTWSGKLNNLNAITNSYKVVTNLIDFTFSQKYLADFHAESSREELETTIDEMLADLA